MKLLGRPLLTCTFVLICACGQKEHNAAGQLQPAASKKVALSSAPDLGEPKITEVKMQRGGCFGSCPVYEVNIRSNGTVSFDGIKYIEKPGHQDGSVTPAEFDALIDEIRRIKFFKLRESYQYKPDGCTSWATDGPGVSISVTRGGEIKHVDYYYGCEGFDAEASIKHLVKSIDRVAKTKKWVGERGSAL